jgi:hypothetical protein
MGCISHGPRASYVLLPYIYATCTLSIIADHFPLLPWYQPNPTLDLSMRPLVYHCPMPADDPATTGGLTGAATGLTGVEARVCMGPAIADDLDPASPPLKLSVASSVASACVCGGGQATPGRIWSPWPRVSPFSS